MGLIYEHWRPDTNECFYVGASRDAEDTRPYFYGHHNDDYDAVVSYLAEKGMDPFTKIIWSELERDCTWTYEKIRISYQRALLGKKLTNRTKGGEGINFDWTPEMLANASNAAKLRWENLTDEQKVVFGELAKERFTNWWASLTEEERDNFCKTRAISQQRRWDEMSDDDREAHRENTRKAVLEYYAHITDEEYAHLCEINREKSLMFWGSISEEELAERCRNLSEKATQMWANRTEDEIAEVALAISNGHKNRSPQDVEKSHQKRVKTLAEKDALAKASGKLTRAEKIRESHLARTEEDVAESHRKRVEARRQKDLELKALGLPTSSEKTWETRRRKKAEALSEKEKLNCP
jgi:hypothetical protein